MSAQSASSPLASGDNLEGSWEAKIREALDGPRLFFHPVDWKASDIVLYSGFTCKRYTVKQI
jgi:hypothetical protein